MSVSARPSDVATPTALVDAVYDVISGLAIQPRDWERFRTLFSPDAHLVPVVTLSDGTTAADDCTVDRYIATRSHTLSQADFFEIGTFYQEHRMGRVAHAFSGYVSTRGRDDTPFAKGVNSVHFFHDGERFWITHLTWDANLDSDRMNT